MKKWMMAALVLQAGAVMAFGGVADMDDLTLAPESYWRGDAESTCFVSGGVEFTTNYSYIPEWSFEAWDGFAYSNISDTTTAGFTNQYSAITGVDVSGAGNYAIGYDPVPSNMGLSSPRATLAAPAVVEGAYFTNDTYAYLSMRDGDQFAKKFGGASGDDPDYLLLTITGVSGEATTGTVEFYLADFRAAAACDDYLVSEWTWVDLSGLGVVTGLEFSISGTDMGRTGLNTPGYFAMDSLTVPEPGTLALLAIGGIAIGRRRL